MTSATSARHDVRRTRKWARDGTAVLLTALARIDDDDLDAQTSLPGWKRRHLLAHLARNAEALNRLLDWARSGVVTPMYADADQRAAEIASSAAFPPARLRRELSETADRLETAMGLLGEQQWSTVVRTARGREVPAAQVPWMRAREVWLHALDLDPGVPGTGLPDDFARELIDDVVGTLAATPDAPAVRIALSSDGRIACGAPLWSIGVGGPVVSGSVVELACWLTGRSAGQGLCGSVPALPAWL